MLFRSAVSEADVKRKFRCGIDCVLKIRALMGDKSDGIPRAVPGVGPVAAARYIEAGVDPSVPTFGDLPRAVRQEAPRLEQYWSTVHMNYRLMRILDSCSDKELPTHVATTLSVETRRVLKELNKPPIRTSDGYSEFLESLTKMGMQASLQNRTELWKLQVV